MRPILCIELNRIFESQKQIQRELGVPQANVYKVLRGQRPKAGGYTFVYAESEVMPHADNKNGSNNKLEFNGRTNTVLQNAS